MLDKNKDPKQGVLTNPIDFNSKAFREFQAIIHEKASALSDDERRQIELFSLQIKMEDYLKKGIHSGEVIEIGEFLRSYLKKLKIKQNRFAHYIGLKPSNFSKILSGERKINIELAFILGHLFELDPLIWIQIQLKNEYMKLKTEKEESARQYRLSDLVN
ncbi:MAG: helix-turn-helix domain-containing protein [Bacteroidota bacterium]